MNPHWWAQDQLDTSERTALYVRVREITVWKCWMNGELNPEPLAPAARGLTTELPRYRATYLFNLVRRVTNDTW